eukprot:3240429-Karenia_brevis.AAC.1
MPVQKGATEPRARVVSIAIPQSDAQHAVAMLGQFGLLEPALRPLPVREGGPQCPLVAAVPFLGGLVIEEL